MTPSAAPAAGLTPSPRPIAATAPSAETTGSHDAHASDPERLVGEQATYDVADAREYEPTCGGTVETRRPTAGRDDGPDDN